MRNLVFRAAIVAGLCATLPIAVSAQTTSASERADRPLFLVGLKKSLPLHEAASIGTLIPLRPIELSNDFGTTERTYRGAIVEASAGFEGFGLAAGWGSRMQDSVGFTYFDADLMATWFRTRGHDKRPPATYVGAEVGFMTMLMPIARFSFGVARRVSGAETADRTIFTGAVGISIGRENMSQEIQIQ